MVRQSLDPVASTAFLVTLPAYGARLQIRTASGLNSIYPPLTTAFGQYLKLVRTGNVFTGYFSTNGDSWAVIGSATVPMSDPVFVGLAVSSGDTNSLAFCSFDHVQIGPAQPPALSISPRINGSVRVSIQALPGWTNVLEASADLAHWRVLTNRFSASGSLGLNDDQLFGRRFDFTAPSWCNSLIGNRGYFQFADFVHSPGPITDVFS